MSPPSCVPEIQDHDPDKQPICHSFNLLWYIRSLRCARSSVSPLLLPRQHLCCCLWMFHAQTLRACSCVAFLVSTKRTAALALASQLHLQERACKCTFDFHSQVTSKLTSSHSGRLATVAQFSLRGTVILLLQAGYCYLVPHILLHRTPTVGWVLLSLWHSILSDTAYWCQKSCWTGCPNGLGSTLSSSLLN